MLGGGKEKMSHVGTNREKCPLFHFKSEKKKTKKEENR